LVAREGSGFVPSLRELVKLGDPTEYDSIKEQQEAFEKLKKCMGVFSI
jgi:hypothetical protein